MKEKVTCQSCGHTWNKSDSSQKDMHICHNCGKSDVNMQHGGWLDNILQVQEGTQTINSRQKKGIELQLQELKKEQEDEKKFHTTGINKHPKSIAFKNEQKDLAKRQTYVTQDNRSEAVKKYDDEKGKAKEVKKQFKKNVLTPLDVVTDLMQIGNFIPHPYAQAIGEIGNIAGAGIDAYQAADDFSEGNYGSGTINAMSAIGPGFIENAGYTRNMYNTNPGSIADKIASLGNRSGNYIPLTLLPHAIAPSTIAGVNYNRALLGALGAETYMDIPKQKNGGWLEQHADGGTMQEHQENYNNSQVSFPTGFVGEGTINGPQWKSPAWGGQFQNGGKATRQDSLALYNNSKKVEDFYITKQGYKSYPRLSSFNIKPEDTHKENDKAFNNFNSNSKIIGGNWYDINISKNDYRKNIDKNKYIQREIAYGAINIDAPMQLFDRRILPKTSKTIVKNSDIVNFGSYNNIANKPFDLLTEKEKIQRVKQYGMDGVPKSYLNKNKKPEQPVIVKPNINFNNPTPPLQKRNIHNIEDLNPEGVVYNADNNIQADLPIFPDKFVAPKYYDVTDRVNQNLGGSETSYKWYPANGESTLQNLALEPYNTRTMTPHYQMGGYVYPVAYKPIAQGGMSMPGAVGFTYARTNSPAPSNGKYAKKTKASAQNGIDMYNNPILANLKYDQSIKRTNYNPRTNEINFGYDMPYIQSQEEKDKTLAHENRHAWQFANNRTNFDIVHNPDYAFQERLKKRPEITSTEEVFNNYHNRKQREADIDVQRFKEINPQFSLVPNELIFKKFVDPMQYSNLNSIEGEAEYYQNTGKQFQNGGEMKYYQEGLDWKPKSISQEGSIIKDNNGYWNPDNWGKQVEINLSNPNSFITMEGVYEPLIGTSKETGETKLMKPGQKSIKFGKGTKNVIETPLAQNGIRQEQKGLVNLDQLTNWTNYNTPQKGGWLEKYSQ